MRLHKIGWDGLESSGGLESLGGDSSSSEFEFERGIFSSWFRVYSLRFHDVSWSHRVHKSTARRGIYARVHKNDARARENDTTLHRINAQVCEDNARGRENNAELRERKKPTDGEPLIKPSCRLQIIAPIGIYDKLSAFNHR